ncbi:VOC family protein [Romeria aff. gracilis LEGE 07310]|uniref:VOC family protein n=1 Tax=Vasconcelosia minhoensis LEGE 07310 TaxID=915328 RepID=A0A8J7A950_9CYAN|nr:VOC family protein [Romeria gracilis]MBE9079532.1 VOC family protein [Romeria aff. gracilis LEGE 07310]
MDIQAAHTRLLVADVGTCAKFYRDILGFTPVTEDIERGYAEFEIANMRLSLFRKHEMAEILRTIDKPATADCQDRMVFILKVHDLDSIYHQLRHKGVTFVESPTQNTDFALKVAYCRDPEDNLIGFFEPMM